MTKYKVTVRVQKTITLNEQELEEIFEESITNDAVSAIEMYAKALVVESFENDPNFGNVKIEKSE